MGTTVTLDERHFKAAAEKARELGTTPEGYIESLIEAATLTFDEVLAPVGEGIRKRGTTEGELDDAWAAAPATLAERAAFDVITMNDFTNSHGLAKLISAGSELASRCFDLDQSVTAELASDRETGEKWVELVVLARGDIPEVQQARRRFTREWLKIVPLEKALLIRPVVSLV